MAVPATPLRCTTKELSKATWPDFVRLFSRGNGWDFCWCMHFHRSRAAPGSRAPSRAERSIVNRRDKKSLVDAGRTHGILVYANGKPIGWCQYGRASEFPRLDESRHYRRISAPCGGERLWRVTCFVVDKRYRRRGVAGTALGAALEAIRRKGGGIVEAYPVTQWRPGSFGNQSTNGPASIFEKEGFKTVARLAKTIHRTNVLMRKTV